MALKAVDRLLTIVVTATLTSAVWIVAGSSLTQRAGSLGTGITLPPRENRQALPPTGQRNDSRIRAGEPARPVAPPAGKLLMPVVGIAPGKLVDTFTAARAGGQRVHDAIDIMAPEGTPVVAAAPGTVERLYLSDRGGKTIYVRSGDRRTIYYYAHLKDYAPKLGENQKVVLGQPLGTVGHTGNAAPEGPHLHFAVMQTTPQAKWWEPSTAINPYPLLARK